AAMIRSPGMEAIQIRCPHCGATIDASGEADNVTCAYCGTPSRVQRRSRVLEIPMRVPRSGPPAVARQVVARGAMITVWVIVSIMLVGFGVGAFLVIR